MRYNYRKHGSNSSNFTYCGCGKQGHMKIQYQNIQNREKKVLIGKLRRSKPEKVYITWKDK